MWQFRRRQRDGAPLCPVCVQGHGLTRKWTRVQDYVGEISLARVLAGFLYRFSTRVGEEMGRRIGDLTVVTQLRGAEARKN